MSGPQTPEPAYVEPNAATVSLRTAGVLLLFTLAFTGLMAGMHTATEPSLQASAKAQKLRLIGEVLPQSIYDNNLLQDSILLPPMEELGTDTETTAYRARRGQEPVALVVEAAAPDGYSGRINLILAISSDARMLAMRVTQHRETPGLGDYIDPKKDRNKVRPWITQFNDRGFDQIDPGHWRVKKDGGDIDQMTGATISARAVTNASRKALGWVSENRTELFAQTSGTRYSPPATKARQ